jgi:hypothetical protein
MGDWRRRLVRTLACAALTLGVACGNMSGRAGADAGKQSQIATLQKEIIVRVFKRLSAGADASDPELASAFTKYLYMINLGDVFSKYGDDEMRGPHLYVLQRLGIFHNRLSRTATGKVEEFPMSDKMKAEVDARLEFVGITAKNPWGR